MDLETVRFNYEKAVSDKMICQSMIKELSTGTESAVHLAYLGAFQTIWAKHSSNPISKLRTFKKGKKNIEDAVMSKPYNIEIRLLRLSVQSNCPSFLGYRKNIEEDKKFIRSNNKNITCTFLKELIAVLT
ncbi:hypothetical protein EPI11_14135 [Flavobacterium cerinum]|uniref:Uncharacterized protein n=2 Tax=Flavobacterium cerinum TaxID=2502784 RepID=A0A444H088_9FLAO|nr:hypothetical protein EPI11_14135 [Flavobacterium cerinum]